ncbi:MAG: hypothetical protein K9J16_17835 [Melioribacteraceae bacterium]|nr:hypothetical protein [Melioribacteraceae bacterium]MCF8355108.1 hypothetical protein [Melioribacteraceae bacterium]MCF8392415.1 hypothetical protein [Melioribacteraceae bacterium]MCF8417936.1 hypothetical protein [Melioribacteraceae bacterium]
MNQLTFPLHIDDDLKRRLEFVLPANRIGYNNVLEKINSYVIIGQGRFGGNNFILGRDGDKPDLGVSSAPMLACGYKIENDEKFYITVHEEIDDQVEIDFTREVKRDKDDLSWSYSYWQPGKKAPGDNAPVREVHLIQNKVVVVVAPTHKKVWVYDDSTQINYIVPVTNFYNEIMHVLGEKDPKLVFNSNRLFDKPGDISDEQIGQGFLLYNKYWKKIDLNDELFIRPKMRKKKSLFSIFRRD